MNPFDNVLQNIPQQLPSPTGSQSQVDQRDDLVYSSIVLQSTGGGVGILFGSGGGTAIPTMAGATTTAPTQPHQLKYGLPTSNIVQNGQLGTIIGDVSVYAIGLHMEVAGTNPVTGVTNAWGGGAYELADISAKCAFRIAIGNSKAVSTGPLRTYPSLGGPTGSLAAVVGTAAFASTGVFSVPANGSPGMGRSIKAPFGIGRQDTIIAEIVLSAGSVFLFRTSGSSNDGAPTLLGCDLKVATQQGLR